MKTISELFHTWFGIKPDTTPAPASADKIRDALAEGGRGAIPAPPPSDRDIESAKRLIAIIAASDHKVVSAAAKTALKILSPGEASATLARPEHSLAARDLDDVENLLCIIGWSDDSVVRNAACAARLTLNPQLGFPSAI